MKIKHIEAQVDVCCKSGRNYRMPQSDFNELKNQLAGEAEPSACLPDGWELRHDAYGCGKWYVFTNEGTHNGGFATPEAAIAGTMKSYRKMWKEALDG
jgi:hypothetical protein